MIELALNAEADWPTTDWRSLAKAAADAALVASPQAALAAPRRWRFRCD